MVHIGIVKSAHLKITMDWLPHAIERMATPRHLRQGTVDEFCALHGTTSKEFYYQLSKEENKKKILEVTLNVAKERAPTILNKLGELAESGDMRAIDTYLDMILQLAKNLDIKSDGLPLIQISEAIAKKNGLI